MQINIAVTTAMRNPSLMVSEGVFFCAVCRICSRAATAGHAAASAEVTSTDRSGSTERPSQLISHQHLPFFHNKNVLLHSSFSVGCCRGVATAVLIAQTQDCSYTRRQLFMPRELDLQGKKKKKKAKPQLHVGRRGEKPTSFFFVQIGSCAFGLAITVCAAAQNNPSGAAAGSSGQIRHPVSAACRLVFGSPRPNLPIPLFNPLLSLTFIQAPSSD